MQDGPETHWDGKRDLYVHWEKWGNDIISPNVCTLTKESGVRRAVTKHWTQMVVQVSNGPFSIGREWFTVENDDKEYKTFDEAIAAAFTV